MIISWVGHSCRRGTSAWPASRTWGRFHGTCGCKESHTLQLNHHISYSYISSTHAILFYSRMIHLQHTNQLLPICWGPLSNEVNTLRIIYAQYLATPILVFSEHTHNSWVSIFWGWKIGHYTYSASTILLTAFIKYLPVPLDSGLGW